MGMSRTMEELWADVASVDMAVMVETEVMVAAMVAIMTDMVDITGHQDTAAIEIDNTG